MYPTPYDHPPNNEVTLLRRMSRDVPVLLLNRQPEPLDVELKRRCTHLFLLPRRNGLPQLLSTDTLGRVSSRGLTGIFPHSDLGLRG